MDLWWHASPSTVWLKFRIWISLRALRWRRRHHRRATREAWALGEWVPYLDAIEAGCWRDDQTLIDWDLGGGIMRIRRRQ